MMSTRLEKKYIDVKGLRMAYTDSGSGSPILFLHGNPTSSYLWRNVIAECDDQHRCVAIDLIGMGDSDKLPNSGPDSYAFSEHFTFLDEAIDKIFTKNEKITLVIHDWGSALGFHWYHRNPERVSSIAYMEAIVTEISSWDDWPENARNVFQGFRSEAGESMILDKNIFVERVLPSSILRNLTDAEMAEYLRPFAKTGEDRRPTLTWPRQIPIEGLPKDVTMIVNDYNKHLQKSGTPKLFVNADPGSILVGKARENCRKWPNQKEVTVKGLHFIQEDSGAEIGQHIKSWLMTI